MRLPSLILAVLLASPAWAGDWTHWRGPTLNGVSPEKDLPEKFEVTQPGKDNLVWKAPYGCRSTPLILGDRIYFNSRTGDKETDQERVVCLDARTGKLIWEHKQNVFLSDIVSNRVGWTNLAADPETGNIYCHGTQGLMTCFDKDGKVLWEHSLAEEFGRVSGYGGRLTSPVVDGDMVIVSIANAAWGEFGRGGCRVIAFGKRSGNVRWIASTGFRVLDTYQSTPIVAVIGGQRLLITGGADGGVHAFKVRTGEKVWSHLFSGGAVNCTPIVDGNMIYIAHGDVQPEVGADKHGRVICLDAGDVTGGKPKVVWQVDGPKIKFASPVLHEGRLILNDEDARLYCLNAKDGKSAWTRPFKYGSGQNLRCSPVLADGKIYIGDSRGSFYVIQDDPKKPKALHEVLVPGLTPAPAELDGAAAVAHGCVYFATNDQMFCISKNGFKATTEKAPEQVKEAPPEANAKATFLQVFPAEVLLSPGDNASFSAHLYDEKGRFLRQVKAEWSLGPMLAVEAVAGLPPPPAINPPPLKGNITDQGKLTVASDVQGQFGNVIAKAEGLTGHARVRQVAKLPYKQDFEKVPQGAVPGGWVNSQVKFQVRKVGDTNVLVKTATNANALVAQANAFIGSPHTTNYTIESDVLGKKVGSDMPDMGVVNSRYSLILTGKNQQLRIISWEGLLRIDKTIPYTWKDDTWYRLKLNVEVKDGKALVRGKVWERDGKEPEKWTLEVEDAHPNLEGAPALFASVPPSSIKPMMVGCEVFFDNVAVTPNK